MKPDGHTFLVTGASSGIGAALVGAPAGDAAALRQRIAGVFDGPDAHQPDALMGVTTDDLLAAVERAVAAAEAETAG